MNIDGIGLINAQSSLHDSFSLLDINASSFFFRQSSQRMVFFKRKRTSSCLIKREVEKKPFSSYVQVKYENNAEALFTQIS